jgi:hypothetical protein
MKRDGVGLGTRVSMCSLSLWVENDGEVVTWS